MRAQLGERLPSFTEEKKLIRGDSQFYDMNSYSAFYIKNRGDLPPDINDHKGNVKLHDTNRAGRSRGLESDTPWVRTAEWGWAKLLRWIWPVYITENGTTAKGEHDWVPKGPDDVLEDPHRTGFFNKYLTGIAKAFQEGVVIKSSFG